MDFRLTEMQADIANLARDFAEKRLVPTVKERDEKETFDRAILDEMGQLGLLGIPWAEEEAASAPISSAWPWRAKKLPRWTRLSP